ncbi:MAG: hypothetical protein FWD17_18385, partial [Polyangiaceae bacterium]|nr:hypothetical protein [Polyangiaceae bacterium]
MKHEMAPVWHSFPGGAQLAPATQGPHDPPSHAPALEDDEEQDSGTEGDGFDDVVPVAPKVVATEDDPAPPDDPNVDPAPPD